MQGTFKVCSECKWNKNCCNDFNNIDKPIISKAEKEIICKKYGVDESNFIRINKGCYNINTQDGRCPFYNNGCGIYEDRPQDCRMYPYDIKLIDNKYYLVRYILKCVGDGVVDENVDEVIENIKPYIKTYTNSRFNNKLKDYKFDIIKEIIM